MGLICMRDDQAQYIHWEIPCIVQSDNGAGLCQKS